MPNDICLNIPQPNSSLNLDLNTAPPPYSTEFDGFNSLVGHLQHTHLAEQQQASPEPVEPSPIAALQLKIVTSSSDNWYSTPYECSCVLEDRFLLLAYREGIQLVDLADKTAKPHIIMWTRIRQIRVIESCRIILMLADKSKPVRCYSYDAILRLIYSVLSLDWSTRRDKMFDVPSLKDRQQVASKSAMNTTPDGEEEEEVPVSAINGLGLAFKERLAKKQKEKVPVDKQACFVVDQPALTKPYYVCDKLIPQEFYYKLSDSKEALDIQSYQTSAYLFVAILHRDKIVLWQRRRDHPLRHFYRFKVFWIPAEAKSISFADDRNTLRHIITVFTSDATSIELRDCKVQTINIDPTLRRIYESTWIREQYEHQLVSPNSPVSIPTKEANPALNENSMLYPTLPASVSVPPIQWTSILQLPFYPDNLPPTTLTTEYSIPPSYATVITTLPTSAPPDPVALPSASAPQLFFATLSKQSFIIDITGSLYSTQVFCWSESPTHVEFIQLDVDTNQWYAVGFGSATVEIMDMKTGKVLQKVMHGVPVKFLGQWNESIVEGSSSKKTKARFKSLIWSCAAKDRSHVYMLKYQ